MYQPRTYRQQCQSTHLAGYRVCINESDLFILADEDIRDRAQERLTAVRHDLTGYIHQYPEFADSLEPVSIVKHAPRIVSYMAEAGSRTGVGPMAAVAGAISQEIAHDLHVPGHDIIVENGGDIYAFIKQPLKVALYAGASPLSMKIGLMVRNCIDGMSVCTSSGSVGHSMSFGNADAVTVVAQKGALADAAATALGNLVQTASDIECVLERGSRIQGVLGVAVIVGHRVGIKGEHLELCIL